MKEGDPFRAAVVVFPGSNCDRDCARALRRAGFDVEFVWHRDTALDNFQLVVLPGGFSYGDYLRAGAVAKVSPIMSAIKAYAQKGGYVLGICNGFQILLEVGLLPGAMTRNESLRFICKDVFLKVENNKTPFTYHCGLDGGALRMPIAHGEGNYRIDEEGYAELVAHNQIVFRYCDASGNVADAFNPNGSVGSIAGICSKEGNVVGMMPHPERAEDRLLGNDDASVLFESVIQHVEYNLWTLPN